MSGNFEPPAGISGFGSLLIWLVATRAIALVDRVHRAGLANQSREYGTVGEHVVPTPSLIAWLMLAAERGLPPEALPRDDKKIKSRQQVLRTRVSRAINNGQPMEIPVDWLRNLAVICEFSEAELEYLISGREDVARDKGELAAERANLRAAIGLALRSPRSLTSQSAVGRPGQASPARWTLPRDIDSFQGRGRELELLTSDPAKIYAVDGMTGTGKTTLCVRAATLLSGHSPDGQIYVHLHGHTPGQQPVRPDDALGTLLLTFCGIDPQRIPGSLEARAALWRDYLHGKRMLLLFDDAKTSSQVRPLLPGSSQTRVLITSRRRLTDLGDVPHLTLGTLPTGDAIELFVHLAGRRGLESADHMVADIVGLCGNLPAAIGPTAAKLAHHPSWQVADVVADFTASLDRLSVIEAEAEQAALTAAFGMSYRDLSVEQRMTFRRLGLHPGSLLDAYSAAALADTDAIAARGGLKAIYDYRLIDEHAAGVYRFHDLVRDYARNLAATDDKTQSQLAIGRLLDYYLRAIAVANTCLAPWMADRSALRTGPGLNGLPPMLTRDQAIAWLEDELPNLQACVEYSESHGYLKQAVSIVAMLGDFLRDQGHWDQARRFHETAMSAARAAGDQGAEAAARDDLGVVQRLTGEMSAAKASHQRALKAFQHLGDLRGQAHALNNLGIVARLTHHQQEEAGTRFSEALRLSLVLDDWRGQAEARANLAFVQFMTSEHTTAISNLEQALRIYTDLGDRRGRAQALTYLGTVQRITCDFPGAIASLSEALELLRGLGNLQGQATALANLGVTQRLSGDYPAAIESLTQTLALFRSLGDPRGEANALNSLGVVRRFRGEYAAAEEKHTAALILHERLGDKLGQANALNFLGAVQRLIGDHAAAISGHEKALLIFRGSGDRQGQADTLNFLGEAQRAAGDLPAATTSQRQALEAYIELSDRHGQAEALMCLGCLHIQAGDRTSASDELSRALCFYRELGSRIGQAQALCGLGQVAGERPGECFTRALGIAREIGAPLEEAHALEGLGICLASGGEREQGGKLLSQALNIYQRIGVPDRLRVETLVLRGGPFV
jgi:tetratricopeptide (TPR) repeat protein